MRIILDGKTYHLSLANVAKFLQAWYKGKKDNADTIDLGNGKRLDFSRKSLIRTGIKAAMVPFVLPMLEFMYRRKGGELPEKVKHEDLLDYMMHNSFGLLALYEQETVYVESIESVQGDGRAIDSVSTTPPARITERRTDTATEASSTNGSEDVGTGGETLLRSRQNGHGQDEVDKGSYQQETLSSAEAERLPLGHEEEGRL